jgi:fatty acid desaturase
MTKQERDVYLAVKRAAQERDDDRSFWAVFTVGALLFFACALVLFAVWYVNF